MSDNIKLIIEIPKTPKNDHERWVLAHGIPLDDVKEEIVALPKTYPFINHIDTYVKEDDVLQILANIGKAESEEE